MKKESNNLSLIKINFNIFSKIRRLIKRIFWRERNCNNTEEKDDSKLSIKSSEQMEEFKNKLKIEESDDIKIFNLQKKYEAGEIQTKNMSMDEYLKIEDLYNKQIEKLKKQVNYNKMKLSTN